MLLRQAAYSALRAVCSCSLRCIVQLLATLASALLWSRLHVPIYNIARPRKIERRFELLGVEVTVAVVIEAFQQSVSGSAAPWCL